MLNALFNNLIGLKRVFLNPKIEFDQKLTLSIRDAVELKKASWIKVIDKESMNQPGISRLMETDNPFRNVVPQEFPEMGIIRIENGRLTGKQGWISTQEGEWISELSWYGATSEKLDFVRDRFKTYKINGKCLSILSDWSDTNYNHFLLDSLGRLALIFRAGIKFDAFDHIFCNIPSDYAQELMIILGIPIEKCITPSIKGIYLCDELFVASYPGLNRFYPQWLVSYLRESIVKTSTRSFRRLYIPRKNNRKILNENELSEILRKYEFETFEPTGNLHAHKIFSEATIIVSAHGAALANLVFCKPGTKVLELLPSDHIYPHYFSLSVAANLNYSCIVGKSLKERLMPKFGPSPYDFYVDAHEFERKLERIVLSEIIN
jgi:hypothetical protein